MITRSRGEWALCRGEHIYNSVIMSPEPYLGLYVEPGHYMHPRLVGRVYPPP